MNIAILGFGTVGKGIYEIIEQMYGKEVNSESNSDTTIGKEILRIKYILVRKGKEKVLPMMCDDYQAILNDKSIDCVVEVMGGIHPAKEYILEALNHGKHVVTANKDVVAHYYEQFMRAAKEQGVQFRFEASVGGGVPWLKSLVDMKRIDKIQGFYGILNGTTNYILDQMTRCQKTFEQALLEAQALGFAEQNPANDIDGIDLKNKLIISMIVAFDGRVDAHLLPTQGIRNIQQKQIEFFHKQGLTLKLMAFALKCEVGYDAGIQLVLFPQNEIGASIHTNFNFAAASGSSIGWLQWIGQGAGKFPTANAILQDIFDLMEKRIQDSLSIFPDKLSLTYQRYGQFWITGSHNLASQTMIKLLFEDALEEVIVESDAIYYKTKNIHVASFYDNIKMINDQGIQIDYARIFDFTGILPISIEEDKTISVHSREVIA